MEYKMHSTRYKYTNSSKHANWFITINLSVSKNSLNQHNFNKDSRYYYNDISANINLEFGC